MSESSQRSTVIRALKPLDARCVENKLGSGTPDVNYIDGWLELKWLKSWPKRTDTIVRIEHFSPQQRNWLSKRWEQGGNCWLLLQCRREWLLFTGAVAAEYVGLVPRAELYTYAWRHWREGLNKKELMACVRKRLGQLAPDD